MRCIRRPLRLGCLGATYTILGARNAAYGEARRRPRRRGQAGRRPLRRLTLPLLRRGIVGDALVDELLEVEPELTWERSGESGFR